MNGLSNVNIVDLTDELGIYAVRVLGTLGARVTRYETEENSSLRAPRSGDRSWWREFQCEYSELRKLDGPGGLDDVLEHSQAADCVIWSSLDGAGGWAWPIVERLRRPNAAVLTIVTPLGVEAGHTPSSDLVVMAAGGFLSLSGYSDFPVVPYGEQSYFATSLHAAFGTLAALYHLRRTGQGQEVEVTALETVAHSLENAVQYAQLESHVRGRTGDVELEAGTGVFACKDGYVFLMSALHGSLLRWDELAGWLSEAGGTEALSDDRWRDAEYRRSAPAKRRFRAQFEAFAQSRTKSELYREGQRRGVNLCPLRTPADVACDEQLVARDFFTGRNTTGAARLGLPFRFQHTGELALP